MPDVPALQQSEQYVNAIRAHGGQAAFVNGKAVMSRSWFGLRFAIVHRASLPNFGDHAPHVILHNAETRPPQGWRILAGSCYAEWNIAPDPVIMWKNLRGNWRTAIRHARRADVHITQSRPTDQDNWIFDLDRAQQKQRGYRNWPKSFVSAYALANPNDCTVYRAHQNTQVIAAIIVFRHGLGATYAIGTTTKQGKAANAHAYLLWHAAKDLHLGGVTCFDLGRLDWKRASNLARFKMGSGATQRTLAGTWAYIPMVSNKKMAHLWHAILKRFKQS